MQKIDTNYAKIEATNLLLIAYQNRLKDLIISGIIIFSIHGTLGIYGHSISVGMKQKIE